MLTVQPFKNTKLVTTLWNFLESSKRLCYRNLQRQTFKTKEKLKKVPPITNFEKTQNTKIKAPSIFALPQEYNFKVIFANNTPLYRLLKNSNVKYSYDLFNSLCTHLKDIQVQDKKELYIESELDPATILKYYQIALPKESEYEPMIKIITKYNVNFFYRPDGVTYTYLSEEGAYEVDKFFQSSITKSENNKYKLISFSEKFFKTEINTIFYKLTEKRKSLEKMKTSTNNKLLSLVYDTLITLGQDHLRIFIRCLITLLFKESDTLVQIRKSKK